jgi:metallo-beta-lactamase class B
LLFLARLSPRTRRDAAHVGAHIHVVSALRSYIASQRKMAAGAASAKATVLMSNHSEFDNAVTKIKTIAARQQGEPHPFEIGAEAVARYFQVSEECAQVARLKLIQAGRK